MRRAFVAIRPLEYYRREAFIEGLQRCGYEISIGAPNRSDPDTVYVCWNRYREWHDAATQVEKAGGRVIVAENGYVGGRHDGGDHYAVALGGHNGSGSWKVGGRERWDALSIDLKPWRWRGGYILVCPNRPFGRPDIVMPPSWHRDVTRRLEKVTRREIRVRPHPGNSKPNIPLADDLANACAVVVWSSSVGIRALIEGIPVIAESPRWVCKTATEPLGVAGIESPSFDDARRERAMIEMSWAQWSLAEIAGGEPFRLLLS